VVKRSGVLHCSDGLSNKVSNIIRRLIDNMKLLLIRILLLPHSFTFFRFYFFNVYMVQGQTDIDDRPDTKHASNLKRYFAP